MKTRKVRVIGLALLVAVVVLLFADLLMRRVAPLQASTSSAEFDSTVAAPVSESRFAVVEPPMLPSQHANLPDGHGIQRASSARPVSYAGRIQPSSVSLNQLQQALVGIRLAQEVVLNNIANAGTAGFKRSQVQFANLGYRQLVLPGAMDEQGQLTPSGSSIGLGMRVSGTIVDHSEGNLVQTSRALDMSVVGDGFFQVQDGSQIVYTRAGTFSMNADGAIVIADSNRGRLLEPTITIPQDTEAIVISSDGTVLVRQAGSQTLTQLGQIQTARFINPQGLVPIGDNLYRLSDASGLPQIGAPGSDGRGPLRSGFLEASNVVIEAELFELRRLESHRRAIHYAMELLTPETPSMLDVGTLPRVQKLLPQYASDPHRESVSRE